MTPQEIEQKVAELVQEAIGGAKPPEPDQNLFDYGADSLDTVEIVLSVEEEFGIQIPDETLDDADTVRKIAALVDQIANACAA